MIMPAAVSSGATASATQLSPPSQPTKSFTALCTGRENEQSVDVQLKAEIDHLPPRPGYECLFFYLFNHFYIFSNYVERQGRIMNQ